MFVSGEITLATANKAKPLAKTGAKSSASSAAKSKVAAPAEAATKAASKVTPNAAPKVASKAVASIDASGKGLMSEADLIKQAKTDYMSKDQLKFFKHQLQTLAAQLRENAGATTEHLRELAVAPDPADRATLEEEHALELRARDRERKLLKKVEAAIVRIDSNDYGYCEETGEPIGIQRLMARPTATLTIEAQERRELKQKMYGE
jgi:DnaK suppressor protein